jgi:uncharacterized protein YidB (DUF937 family)
MANANLGKVALAVLGILAFKNRDKIGELLRGSGQGDLKQDGLIDELSKATSGTALGDILERFRSSGAGSKVDSWIRNGPNDPVEAHEVESAIDEETLASLSRQTGLSRQELIDRITRDLPDAVDSMTPEGRLPSSYGTGDEQPSLLDDVPSQIRSS